MNFRKSKIWLVLKISVMFALVILIVVLSFRERIFSIIQGEYGDCSKVQDLKHGGCDTSEDLSGFQNN